MRLSGIRPGDLVAVQDDAGTTLALVLDIPARGRLHVQDVRRPARIYTVTARRVAGHWRRQRVRPRTTA